MSAVRARRHRMMGGMPPIIELDPTQFGPDALAGLGAFSHVAVRFHFHQATAAPETGAHVARGTPAWPKVGILAQRAKGDSIGNCLRSTAHL